MPKPKPVQTPLQKIPPYTGSTEAVNAVVETPKGSRNKYKYEPMQGVFRLHRVLPAGAVFPFDFGYIPGTLGADGDPLDILLILDEPAFTGCVVEARLLGVIEAEQTQDGRTFRNDRLVGVASASQDHAEMTSLKAVSDELLKELEHFFTSYDEMEGKQFKPIGCRGPRRAHKLIQDGIQAARKAARR